MNEQAITQLDAELAHAGQQTALSPQQLLLEQLRITTDKQLKPMDFLFRLFGKPCFPRGELVAITGKAKSGKTFVTSMLMAIGSCRVAKGRGELQRSSQEPLRVLWYDTEQSDESTQDILKNRVARMVDGTPDCDVFNVRSVAWQQRRELLLAAVDYSKPDLVVIDGIRDLVNDINDGCLAQEVMEELMHVAAVANCCIVCVLHQNKSGEDHNLRGWIGTELMNKAFEVYTCEKLLPQRIFKLEQSLTRKYDIEQSMYFEVGSDGLPKETAPVVAGGGENTSAERLPMLNSEYIVNDDNGWQFDVSRLFLDALHGEAEIGGQELRQRVMKLSGVVVPFKYNQLLTEAIKQKVIEKSMRDNRTIYRAAPF
ncbi:MAG: AAA family ATPase [Prevotella sp.]|nr:AAA family ATPase [Prevotella sp.]